MRLITGEVPRVTHISDIRHRLMDVQALILSCELDHIDYTGLSEDQVTGNLRSVRARLTWLSVLMDTMRKQASDALADIRAEQEACQHD